MGLQVWLPLNGNLNNQGLANYTISVFRGTETYDNNGKIGKCFYSHGVNTLKIQNIISDFYNYTAYSLCAWFYIESNNTSHSGSAIISGGNWNNQLINLSVSDWSQDHYTKLRISGTSWNNVYSYNFQKNVWYHVVVCCDGNHTYAYVNGVLIGNTANSFLPTDIEGNDICIGGATYYSGMQFFGKINDVRIYDHCLSPREVKEISKGLVLHYPLNGIGNPNLCVPQFSSDKWTLWSQSSSWSSINTREKIVDTNGKTWCHVVQTTTSGYGGYSCTNGVNGNGIVIDPNKKYTISALAKTNAQTTQKMVFWCHWRAVGNGSNLAQSITQVDVTSTPKRVYVTWTPSAGTSGATVDSINLMVGTYANVSDVYFTDIKVEEGEVVTSFIPYVIGTNNLANFRSIASEWTVDGATVSNYTDEIYGNVLKVITSNANKRIYKNFSWTNGITYTVSFIAKADMPIICDMSRSIADFSGNINLTTEWRRYSVLITSTATGGTLSFRLITAGTVYITCITLEKGDTRSGYDGFDNIEYDTSGYKNNGFKNGIITYSGDAIKYNGSYLFDGSTAFIEADHLPAETKTISIWLKTAWSSSSGYRMAVHDKTSGLAIGWSSGQLITYIGSTNGGSGSRIDTSGHYIANQWNHIVVVKTGDTTRDVYINGQLMTPSSVNYWGGGHDKLNIGNRILNGSYSAYFNGQMSDFRAYTTALSADDILELYHTPISLSNNGTLLTQGEYVES